MARRAADPFVDVNTVIEIHEVRQVVYPCPIDRLARTPALANWLQIRTRRPYLRVAVHAGLRRRNAGEGFGFHGGVAVAAVDSIIARVMLVAELNRLLARKERLRVVRRSIEFKQQPYDQSDEEYSAKDADPGNKIRAALKNLPH